MDKILHNVFKKLQSLVWRTGSYGEQQPHYRFGGETN